MNRLVKTAVGGVAALVLGVAGAAQASTSITVAVQDLIYGPFNGSTSTGELSWSSAGFFWGGNIGLTDAGGTILYDIHTNFDDFYRLYSPGGPSPNVGQDCATHATTCVTLSNGVPTSLFAAVSAANGGNGICCGDASDIVVTLSGAVPEPAAWTLMIAGFGFAGAGLRSRRRVAKA